MSTQLETEVLNFYPEQKAHVSSTATCRFFVEDSITGIVLKICFPHDIPYMKKYEYLTRTGLFWAFSYKIFHL